MSYKRISPQPIVEGGTGVQSTTAYAVLCGGTTSTGALQSIAGVGTSGQVLTSNGAGALPTFQAAGGGGGINIINGNTGSVTGSTVTITGSTSGLVFTGSSATLTSSFNFISLPTTTSTNGQILINSTRFLHGYGGSSNNIFGGFGAGNFTLTGQNNSVYGTSSSTALTSASDTISIGSNSASNITSGSDNISIGVSAAGTVMGSIAPQITSGIRNISIGSFAAASIGLSTAQDNICIGFETGSNIALSSALASCNSNVIIGNQALWDLGIDGSNVNYNVVIGTFAGENVSSDLTSSILINTGGNGDYTNSLQIGSGTGTGTQQLNSAYISGIRLATVTGTPVLVSSGDQLGIAASSERFKENIKTLKNTNVLDLRPVSFNYKSEPDGPKHFGLIAEEVHEVMPELVVLDDEGAPFTVQYYELPVLLLNEIQKLRNELNDLKESING